MRRDQIWFIEKNEQGESSMYSLSDFKVNRYSKPMSCMKLKDKDEVVNAYLNEEKEIFIATENGYSLWFDESEIPSSGIKSSGVKSINLKNDIVVSSVNFNESS